MQREYESIDWDSQRKGVVITKQEFIDIEDAENISEAKTKLRQELQKIVTNVKALKKRAEEIRSLLNKLDEKPTKEKPLKSG